jgi:AcrR family transcriptional regulator
MAIRLLSEQANRIMIRQNSSARSVTPRRRLSAARRRDLVLEAATRAFAECGYEGAAVADIAERAGVVASVVYDHFGSKRELYLELLTIHARTLIERTTGPRPGATAQELFEAGLEAFYRFVETDPFGWRMLFRDPPADPAIEAVHREIQRRARDEIASVRPGEPLVAGVARAQADALLAGASKRSTTAWPTGGTSIARSRASRCWRPREPCSGPGCATSPNLPGAESSRAVSGSDRGRPLAGHCSPEDPRVA